MAYILVGFSEYDLSVYAKKSFSKLGFGKKEFIQLCDSMKGLDLSGELDRISCPVLVVLGEKDKANRRAAGELAEALTKNQMEIIAGAGHEVNVERPKELAQVLERFWNSL